MCAQPRVNNRISCPHAEFHPCSCQTSPLANARHQKLQLCDRSGADSGSAGQILRVEVVWGLIKIPIKIPPPRPAFHLFCPFSSKQLYSPRTQHSRAGVISPEHVKHSLRFFFSFLLFPILFHPLVWRTLSSPHIFTHQSSHFSLPSLCFLTSFFRAETNK